MEVTAVHLIDEADKATLSHTTGSPVTIEIHFASHRNLRETVFGIKISNVHGVDIWGANSKRRRQFIETLRDSGVVRIHIPSLPLLEGTYSLTVTATDHTERKIYDCWDKRIRFDVTPGANFDEGLVTVDSTWDTSQARR